MKLRFPCLSPSSPYSPGKTLCVTMKSISPVDADGNVEVVFIMNGMPRSITIKSKKISKAAAAAAASTHRPKADKAVPGENYDEDPLPPTPTRMQAR